MPAAPYSSWEMMATWGHVPTLNAEAGQPEAQSQMLVKDHEPPATPTGQVSACRLLSGAEETDLTD